jgi:hypothetical protein
VVRSYQVSKSIHATPDRIWSLLTDAPAYPSWNPAVQRVEGRIAPSETIKVFVPVNPGRAFPVKVTAFDQPTRMVWTGGLPLGLFKGERTFSVTPAADGSSEFRMQEVYTGPLAGMMFKQIPDLSGSFDQFGEAVKRAAEAAEQGAGG